MAEPLPQTFIIELASARRLEPDELQRALARFPGVLSVTVSDPYATDPEDATEEGEGGPLDTDYGEDR